MAKILLKTLVFSPDGVSTATLMTELALELKLIGHEVKVLTTTPHYNKDTEVQKDQYLHRRWGGFLYNSDCKGIQVLHARVSQKGSRVMSRIFDYIQFHIISTIAGLKLIREYDVVFAPSPPLTIGLTAWILGIVRRVPFIYNLQEIYPDVAIDLGILKNKCLIDLLKRIECFIYNRSHVIVVISHWFRRRLIAKGISEKKIIVIPNFVDTDFMKPKSRHNAFSRLHGLDNKFVVLYAGNIGLTQNIENVLAVAKKLINLPDLCLLIVGDGTRREWLYDQLSQYKMPNVKLLPYQNRSVIPDMYASSDICLIPLKGGTAHVTFPSKIYTIMAAGRPVIASVDTNSELSWLIKESACGWTVSPDNATELAESITLHYQNQSDLLRKGTLGRQYVVKYHSKQVVVEQYDSLIRNIIKNMQPH